MTALSVRSVADNVAAACRSGGFHCRLDKPHTCKVKQNFGRDKPAILANCSLGAVDLFLLIILNYLTNFNFFSTSHSYDFRFFCIFYIIIFLYESSIYANFININVKYSIHNVNYICHYKNYVLLLLRV